MRVVVMKPTPYREILSPLRHEFFLKHSKKIMESKGSPDGEHYSSSLFNYYPLMHRFKYRMELPVLDSLDVLFNRSNMSHYLWWDTSHLSTYGQQILGEWMGKEMNLIITSDKKP